MSECEKHIHKISITIFMLKKSNVYLKKLTNCCETGEIEQSVVDYKNLLKKITNIAKKSALNSLVSYFSNVSEWIGTEYFIFF